MAQIESIVEPDCIGDDVGWESVALVCIHAPILSILESLLVITVWGDYWLFGGEVCGWVRAGVSITSSKLLRLPTITRKVTTNPAQGRDWQLVLRVGKTSRAIEI